MPKITDIVIVERDELGVVIGRGYIDMFDIRYEASRDAHMMIVRREYQKIAQAITMREREPGWNAFAKARQCDE